MNNKSPAFQFYPGDFLSDENVISMNFEERGIYITLLCSCWIQGSIPADPARILRLLPGFTGDQLPMIVRDRFQEMEGNPDRLINNRLEKERQKQEDFKEAKSESGKRGAEKRWENHEKKPSDNTTMQNKPSNGCAIDSPMAKNSSSVFSLQSSSSSSNNKPVDSLWEKEKQEAFKNRWKTYPGKKDGHKAATNHWNASIKKPQDVEKYDLAIENYKQSVRNERNNGFPDLNWKNGSTWFNNWQDYIPAETSGVQEEVETPPPKPRRPTDPKLEKLWSDCLEKIKAQIPAESFKTWFEPTYPHHIEQGILTVACPNQYTRKFLIESYRVRIEMVLKEISGKPALVDFCINSP